MMNLRLKKRPTAPETTESGAPAPKRGRGLTIRLKLTLWYGSLFLLAGVLLIAMNYFMVRDSLVPAPGEARTYVEEVFGLEAGLLDPQGQQSRPRGPQQIWISVDGELVTVPVPALIAEAQNHLKDEALRQLWLWSLVALGVMTILTFGSAWLVAGRMLRPLRAITDTARRLSDSTLHERIALKGPRDELKDLADTFDDMLARLGTAFSAQKEFVANASHELRTPLTIIRTELDVALSDPDLTPEELRDMGEAIAQALDRSERLIDSRLAHRRLPGAGVVDLAPVDDAGVVRPQQDDGLELAPGGQGAERHGGYAAGVDPPRVRHEAAVEAARQVVGQRHGLQKPGGVLLAGRRRAVVKAAGANGGSCVHGMAPIDEKAVAKAEGAF